MSLMRPTFQMHYRHPKEAFFRRVTEELSNPPWRAMSLVFDDYAELHLAPSELRYWSPHLSLSFDGDERHTRVVGRFAPRQEVWTLVWILYLAFTFVAFFAFVFAYAQWTLGKATWISWLIPISLAGIAVLYAISYIGQQLSADQMLFLRSEWSRLADTVDQQVGGCDSRPAEISRG